MLRRTRPTQLEYSRDAPHAEPIYTGTACYICITFLEKISLRPGRGKLYQHPHSNSFFNIVSIFIFPLLVRESTWLSVRLSYRRREKAEEKGTAFVFVYRGKSAPGVFFWLRSVCIRPAWTRSACNSIRYSIIQRARYSISIIQRWERTRRRLFARKIN